MLVFLMLNIRCLLHVGGFPEYFSSLAVQFIYEQTTQRNSGFYFSTRYISSKSLGFILEKGLYSIIKRTESTNNTHTSSSFCLTWWISTEHKRNTNTRQGCCRNDYDSEVCHILMPTADGHVEFLILKQ